MTNDNFPYPIHILSIKLWEWEAVKDNAHVQIMRHGPDQTMCEALETAGARISELKAAILTLTSHT